LDTPQAEVNEQGCYGNGALCLPELRAAGQQWRLGIEHEVDGAAPELKLQSLIAKGLFGLAYRLQHRPHPGHGTIELGKGGADLTLDFELQLFFGGTRDIVLCRGRPDLSVLPAFSR
jgi:hypothetical protein